MKKDIAILLPYKEKFNINKAGAASIWVKDYLSLSKLGDKTRIYGNLENKDTPLAKNFKNINLDNVFIKKKVPPELLIFYYIVRNNIKMCGYFIFF